MVKSIFAFFLLFLFSGSSYCQDNEYRKQPEIFALVVGIGDYRDDALGDLKYPEKDAQDFYNFLRSPNGGAVPKENMSLLVGPAATRPNVMRQLNSLFRRSTEEDEIIFYFAGHGNTDDLTSSGYLLTYDTEFGNEAGSALYMSEFRSRMEYFKAKMKIAYVDACHAGMLKVKGSRGNLLENNAGIAAMLKESIARAGSGTFLFLASSAKEQSIEQDKLQNGVFTHYLVKGLVGEADNVQKGARGYNNGIVTIGELIQYVKDKVARATGYTQSPSYDGVYESGFPLSVTRANVSLPAQISKTAGPKGSQMVSAASTARQAPAPVVIDEPTYVPIKGFPDMGGLGYGIIWVLNYFNEPVLLYCVQNTCTTCGILVSPGSKGRSPKVTVGTYYEEKGVCIPASNDCRIYFKTTDPSKQIRYGSMIVSVEAGKEVLLPVSARNLNLTVDGPRFE